MIEIDALTMVKFGLFRGRLWGRTDHLVVLLHDKNLERFYMLDQRQVNTKVRALDSGLLGPHDPDKRIDMLLGEIGIKPDSKFKRTYVGSLHVSDKAVFNRHFIMVDGDVAQHEDVLKPFGLYQIDLASPLIPQVGRFHAPVVLEIINHFGHDAHVDAA